MEVEGYDLVMIGILAVAGLLGYFRGIVWQVASILGIVASGFVALRFGAQVAPWFGQTAPWNQLSGMLALYAATSAGVNEATRHLEAALGRVADSRARARRRWLVTIVAAAAAAAVGFGVARLRSRRSELLGQGPPRPRGR